MKALLPALSFPIIIISGIFLNFISFFQVLFASFTDIKKFLLALFTDSLDSFFISFICCLLSSFIEERNFIVARKAKITNAISQKMQRAIILDDVFAKIYTSLKAISGLYRQNRTLIAISDIKIETPFILKMLRILDMNERDNFTTDPRFD